MNNILLILSLHLPFGLPSLFDTIKNHLPELGIPFRGHSSWCDRPILPEYNFIIVGSGPAGSALANRLSEDPKTTVLLVETGDEGNVFNEIPIFNEYTVLGSHSMNYDLERGNSCLGHVGGIGHWPSGNGVGGASILNAMVYTRGPPRDYDEWAEEGNTGWSYKEVLRYFLKLENMSIPDLARSEYHSTTGPLHIQYPAGTEIGKRFRRAGREMGYNAIDYNNPNTPIGFSRTQVTIKGVKRHSAVSAYLYPVKSRTNLHVVKNAFVTKVLTDLSTKTVYGIEIIKNCKRLIVRATLEVILSAGGFGSPRILLLSGIGPAKHLREVGIPLVAELPVGLNLQEHPGTPVTFMINTTDSLVLQKIIHNALSDLIRWSRGKQGLFSSNLAESLGFIQTKHARDERPDIELISIAATLAGEGGVLFRRSRNISADVFYKTYGPILFDHGFTIAPLLMYPKSRGTLKLRSSNPRDPPIIDGNFLSDPYDVAVMVEGIRAAIKLSETKAFREIGARLYTNPVHGCEHCAFNSDKYWECAMRTIVIHWRHQSGTCRMGPDPSSSVVDPRLKVHGLKGLRVAGAAMMPTLPGLHPMAPCYMIGEKAADLIKEDYGIRDRKPFPRKH